MCVVRSCAGDVVYYSCCARPLPQFKTADVYHPYSTAVDVLVEQHRRVVPIFPYSGIASPMARPITANKRTHFFSSSFSRHDSDLRGTIQRENSAGLTGEGQDPYSRYLRSGAINRASNSSGYVPDKCIPRSPHKR